ncbi:MAG TPA: hypothetical protein VFX37_15085 [Pseudolabrys sp.]|nr:hypothetical protein [Pseudolabrys sp.]
MSDSDLPAGFVLGPPNAASPAAPSPAAPTSAAASAPAAGGLPPGFVMGAPGPLAHKFGLGDTWPARLAKSIWSAITLPGDVYSGKARVDPSNPAFIGRTLNLATLASPVAPAGLTAAPTIAKTEIPTADTLKAAADAGYDAARSSPLVLKADAVKNMASGLQDQLNQKGILPAFAPDTHAVLNALQNPPAGGFATGGNLISAREALRLASQNFTNPREALAANHAISGLDDFIENPPAGSVVAGSPAAFAKIARDARGNYAASKRSDLVNGQVDVAEGNAAAANSGQNIGNALRQRFNSVLKSDKASSGFTSDELAQMERVRDGTLAANAARFGGNLLGGGGGLGAVASAAVGAGALGPGGAAAPLVGYGLKKFSDAMVRREIAKLDEMTRARAPLAQSMNLAPPASPLTVLPQSLARQLLLRSALGGRPIFAGSANGVPSQP